MANKQSSTYKKLGLQDLLTEGPTYTGQTSPAPIHTDSRQLLAIPKEYSDLLPCSTLSVAELLDFDFPLQESTLIPTRATGLFSVRRPNENLRISAKRPLPTQAYLDDLNRDFKQAILEGRANSIVDRVYKQTYSPLPILGYWNEAVAARLKRQQWRDSEMWLNKWEKRPGHLEDVDEVRRLLRSLPWAAPLQALGERN